MQFTERVELTIFVTNPAQYPKDVLKFINYVDFVAQRTKNTLIRISINVVDREKKWNAVFCDVLSSFLETVEECTWAPGTVDELAFSTGEHKDSVRSEGDPKRVGRLFQREAGQDCVTYRSAIGYAVLHCGLHHRHGYTLSLPLFSC